MFKISSTNKTHRFSFSYQWHSDYQRFLHYANDIFYAISIHQTNCFLLFTLSPSSCIQKLAVMLEGLMYERSDGMYYDGLQ